MDKPAKPMMRCGHAANATTEVNGERVPCCVICAGIKSGAYEIDNDAPDLSNRMAKCCSRPPVPSNTNLAFFSYQPDREFDHYYCGHAGWD